MREGSVAQRPLRLRPAAGRLHHPGELVVRPVSHEETDGRVDAQVLAGELIDPRIRLRDTSRRRVDRYVEETRERMKPVGFRMGADDTPGGDSEAWRIWQANHLDADSPLVHRASLAMGDAYVIVGPVDEESACRSRT